MTRDFAPVAQFALAVTGTIVTGFAAPARGRLPCLLRLVADGETIALAGATRFSAEASARGVRLGWCGVELAGLHLAAALADAFEVRCAHSDALLLRAPAPEAAPTAQPPLSVLDLIAFARRDLACTDLARILPFAEVSYRTRGVAGLLAAAYRTLLRREADPEVVTAWQTAPPVAPATAALLMICHAAEFRDDPLAFIPGPFHPAFAFDLSPLEG